MHLYVSAEVLVALEMQNLKRLHGVPLSKLQGGANVGLNKTSHLCENIWSFIQTYQGFCGA